MNLFEKFTKVRKGSKWVVADPKGGALPGFGEFDSEDAVDKKLSALNETSAKTTRIMELAGMFPAGSTLLEDKKEDMIRLLSRLEKNLHHDSRYKSFDVNTAKKIVYWVSQEASDARSASDAKKLAKLLATNGYPGWTVNMIIRDKWQGNNDRTEWESYTHEDQNDEESKAAAKAAIDKAKGK